jgi:ADP-ribose pyrophosphatase YjhB (NUDIX family)
MTRIACPHCGGEIDVYRNPIPTVDIIVENEKGEVLLVNRKNPPHGWALPGGFVNAGESLEEAAARELAEETGLTASCLKQFHAFSRPDRDPRCHTLSVVFLAQTEGKPKAADDAAFLAYFPLKALPSPLAFDHEEILNLYRLSLRCD